MKRIPYDPVIGEWVVFVDAAIDIDGNDRVGVWEVCMITADSNRVHVKPVDELARLHLRERQKTNKGGKISQISVSTYGMVNYVVASMIHEREQKILAAANEATEKRNIAEMLRDKSILRRLT